MGESQNELPLKGGEKRRGMEWVGAAGEGEGGARSKNTQLGGQRE